MKTKSEKQTPYGARLEHAIDLANSNQSALAQTIGVKQQSISSLVNSGASSRYTVSIAQALNVDANWLATGEGSPRQTWETNVSIAKYGQSIKYVPVISFVQAGEWREAIAQEASEYEAVSGIMSADTFALDIRGTSMYPEFKEGERIIVDPHVQPNPSDYVIAQNGKTEATFKKYRPRGLNEKGEEVFELVPLNPDFPTLYSDREKIVIIGTVIEHIRKFRRSRES